MELVGGKLSRNRKMLVAVICGCSVLALTVAGLAPPEESLGELVRLVYIHVAFTWVGLAGFTLSALLGAVFIVGRQKWQFIWSVAFQRAALGFWSAHVVLGFITMIYIWGGIVWGEPRLFFTAIVFLAAVFVYLLSRVAKGALVASGMNAALGGGIWVLLVRTGRVFHPSNPIVQSSDAGVWLFPLATTILLMMAFGATAYLAYLRQIDRS